MNDPTATPARSLVRWKVVACVVLVAGVIADLASKSWLEGLLRMDPSPDARGPFGRIEVIEGFFALEGTYNPGVTFGLAPGQTVAILVFTIIATLALVVWLLATKRHSPLLHVALGMVLAGALGNLYDRILWQKVRDFFLVYVGAFEWPNFNVADSLIVVGVILILYEEIFGRRHGEHPRADAGTT